MQCTDAGFNNSYSWVEFKCPLGNAHRTSCDYGHAYEQVSLYHLKIGSHAFRRCSITDWQVVAIFIKKRYSFFIAVRQHFSCAYAREAGWFCEIIPRRKKGLESSQIPALLVKYALLNQKINSAMTWNYQTFIWLSIFFCVILQRLSNIPVAWSVLDN